MSASGNVVIEAATPTLTFSETATSATATVALSGTTLTATSDSVVLQNTAGNVKLEVVDSALNDVIVMSANGGVNRLSVFGAETYIGGANPTLRFNNDSSATQADIAFNGTTLTLINVTSQMDISPDSVSIQTNIADSSISMGVASGNAGLSITDLGGLNNIESSAGGATLTVGNSVIPSTPAIIMTTNGNANQLKVTGNHTEIVGDTGSAAPLLKFVDSSNVVPPFEMTLVNDGVDPGVRMTYFDSSAVPATILKFQDNGVYIVGDGLGTGYVPQLHFKDITFNTSAVLSLNGNNFQLNADVFTVASSNVRLASIPLATKSNILYYDSVTNIVSYGANVLPVFVTGPTSATPITLTAADNNKTFVFTSRPSAFQQFNAVGLPLGFSISVRNAVGPGNDIDIRKDAGVSLGTLHPRTGAVNASTVPLEVNGTGLIGYF